MTTRVIQKMKRLVFFRRRQISPITSPAFQHQPAKVVTKKTSACCSKSAAASSSKPALRSVVVSGRRRRRVRGVGSSVSSAVGRPSRDSRWVGNSSSRRCGVLFSGVFFILIFFIF